MIVLENGQIGLVIEEKEDKILVAFGQEVRELDKKNSLIFDDQDWISLISLVSQLIDCDNCKEILDKISKLSFLNK